MRRLVMMWVAFFFACYEPKGPTYEQGDAAPEDASTSACQPACEAMKKLGCPEGQAASCVDTCKQTQGTGKFDLKPACIASAKTRDELAVCGTVRCMVKE